MRIYVSELPKSCEECPMCRSGKLKLQRKGRYVEAKQCVFGKYKYQTTDDEIDTCPLQSLTEHDKKVKKEVVKEIKETMNKFGKKNIYNNNGDVIGVFEALSLNEIINILNQLQGENNGIR